MKPGNSSAQPAGFTLLEVLVAMAIVGLGVVTLLEIFSLGLRLGARSSERSEVVAHSRQVLDNFLARREVLDGAEEGTFGEELHWSLVVEPREKDPAALTAPDWELKKVTLAIEYWEGGDEKRLQFETLRLVKKK